MSVDVDNLRRRPPGPRVLVYLDQSTLSALVSEERFAAVRDQLTDAVNEGRLVCPNSLEHTGETIAAPKTWEEITQLAHRLSMGIEFHDEKALRDREVSAAATQFFGGASDADLWEEAFETDPHTPREKLFAGGFQVHAYFPPDELRLKEIENLREIELALKEPYEEARHYGYTFEQQVEREFEAMIEWMLGPLVDGGRMLGRYERLKSELVSEWERGIIDTDPGSVYSHYLAACESLERVSALVQRFPELPHHAQEFATSGEFRSMPALRYPPIFRAAIAVMAGREPKRGDGHDIIHLTRGLSRCEVVTADAGMTQLCLNHKLVSADCTLLRFNDVDGLSCTIENALAEQVRCD